MKKTEAEYKRDSASLGKVEASVAEFEGKLARIKYQEGSVEGMDTEFRQIRAESQHIRNQVVWAHVKVFSSLTILTQVERVFGRYPNLNFEFRDPVRGFDRRQVRGVAARLFSIPDPSFCMALETVAGIILE